MFSTQNIRISILCQGLHIATAIPSWNTSSRKITEVNKLGPWLLASPWMGDSSSLEVDAVVKITVKSQERRNGASNINSWGPKKTRLLQEGVHTFLPFAILWLLSTMCTNRGLNAVSTVKYKNQSKAKYLDSTRVIKDGKYECWFCRFFLKNGVPLAEK